MKASRGDHIDRISNLPNNVVDDIMRYLPIQDVVRTSVLSKKWRSMWISIPQLEFEFGFFGTCYLGENEDYEIPITIITKILSLHNGPISKFTLCFPHWYPSEISQITCLSNWIMFLSRNGIKHLEIYFFHGEGDCEMPSQLFSCQGLTYLKLWHFGLTPPPNFCGFKSLLVLHLINIAINSGALERLIAGCPVLNVLTISCCFGFDCVHVFAPNLKVLCIDGGLDGGENIKSLCFKNANNLTGLTLKIASRGQKFEQVNVSGFIKGMPKIERLCVSRGNCNYLKILSTGITMQALQKSITSLKYLELDGVDFSESKEILFVASLLKSSSILVELVIKEPVYPYPPKPYSSSVAEAPEADHLRALYCNRCCLSQLRKVNITVGTAYEHALDLIRFLLANSSSLEILSFKVGVGHKQLDTPTLLSISQDLLKMGRASQKAEVKFLYV